MNEKEIADPEIQGQKTQEDVPPTDNPSVRTIWWCSGLAVVAWGLHLFVSYSLVEWYCRNQETMSNASMKLLLHGLTLALGLVAVACTVVSRNYSSRLKREKGGSQKAGRAKFMASFSTVFCGSMVAIILVQGIPNWVVALCW